MTRTGDYTVFIDGYNVIMRHATWSHLPLADARTRLVELAGRGRWPVPVGRIVIVFDAASAAPAPHEAGPTSPVRPAIGSHRAGRGRVEVRFVSPSADADIQREIRTSRYPERLVVISDDRDILHTAKRHGARRESARSLLERPRPTRQHDAVSTPEKLILPAAAARAITDELAKRWLDRSS